MWLASLSARQLPLRLLFQFSKRSVHKQTRKVKCRRRGNRAFDTVMPELIIDKPPTFYANLQQKLDRINYYDNLVNEVNIGHGKDSECMKNFLKSSNDMLEQLKLSNKSDEYELPDFEETIKEISLTPEEYRKLSDLYSLTPNYLTTTISLANQFAIFRDLFFVKEVRLETHQQKIEDNAKNMYKFDLKTQAPTFTFSPLIPIEAEFYRENGEDILCQRSCRGNLIEPEYGLKPPTIVLNTAAINGQVQMEDSQEKSSIILNSGKAADPSFYTLALVNLDSHFNDSGVCHWMLANIHKKDNETTYETAIKYLPIYGVRGLGYHRYAFVLFQHNKSLSSLNNIEDFDLGKRKFNGLQFMRNFTSQDKDLEMTPVGLTWFQTTWNENCTKVFYDYLNMRAPTYEYIHPKQSTIFEQIQFPGRAPFNIYLDRFRDPKELSKEVLLERLKSINPLESYDSKRLYPTFEGQPVLPHIFHFGNNPDWIKATIKKKRAQVGRFRGLRPASAILPYNNNADLDKPKWPRISPDVVPLNLPIPYPDGKRRPIPLKDTPWVKPIPEHHSLRVPFPENLEGKDRKILEDKSAISKEK